MTQTETVLSPQLDPIHQTPDEAVVELRSILMGELWADSTGRRNTFHHILFEQPVECLRRRLPAQRLAWPRIQSMGNGAQFFCAMFVEVRSLGKVLAKQTIRVLVASALPGALWVAEVDVEACIDPELGVLCHLGALVPGQ